MMSKNEKSKTDEVWRMPRWVLPVVAIVVLCAWYLGGLIPWQWLGPAKSGALLGDSFGSVNALFSALAFLGVIWAIVLQREELSLQRIELRHTREELKRSADAQEDTKRALELSAYINSFSAMMKAYGDNIPNEASSAIRPAETAHRKLLIKLHSLYRELEDRTTSDVPQPAKPSESEIIYMVEHYSDAFESRINISSAKGDNVGILEAFSSIINRFVVLSSPSYGDTPSDSKMKATVLEHRNWLDEVRTEFHKDEEVKPHVVENTISILHRLPEQLKEISSSQT